MANRPVVGSRRRISSKEWSGATFDNVNVTATQVLLASVTISLGAGQSNTVLRSRGEIILQAVPDAATDTEIVAIGIGVVTEQARAVGGTSLPGPITELAWDGWLYHRFIALEGNPLTAASADAILLNRIIEIDSKAMRKLPSGSAVVLVAQASIADMVVTAIGGIRWLLGH